jgi:protein arginine kinase activator
MENMICNICGSQEATIHLTEIINNQMMEIHLCEACAQEKGTDFKTHFAVGDLIGGLAEAEQSFKPGKNQPGGKCPECGQTYDEFGKTEFGKTGRLGCAGCYTAFTKMLLPLIKRVQRSTNHVGKRPGNVSKQISHVHDLRVLQDRLRKTVQLEEFEAAAKIRDEIRQIEDKIKKTGKKGKAGE